jgi:hypothetical protein
MSSITDSCATRRDCNAYAASLTVKLQDTDRFRRPQYSAFVATPDGSLRQTTIEFEGGD